MNIANQLEAPHLQNFPNFALIVYNKSAVNYMLNIYERVSGAECDANGR